MSRRCSRPTYAASTSDGSTGASASPPGDASHGGHDAIDDRRDVGCQRSAPRGPASRWPRAPHRTRRVRARGSAALRGSATAYSSEPSTESEITWPALRTTNASPSPTSKMISADETGVAAAEDRHERALGMRERGSVGRRLDEGAAAAGDEALIAAAQLAPRRGRGVWAFDRQLRHVSSSQFCASMVGVSAVARAVEFGLGRGAEQHEGGAPGLGRESVAGVADVVARPAVVVDRATRCRRSWRCRSRACVRAGRRPTWGSRRGPGRRRCTRRSGVR